MSNGRRWARAVAGWCAGPVVAAAIAASNLSTQNDLPYVIDGWDTDNGLPQNSVTSILQSQDGYLWLGTLNGLVRFDGSQFTVFDESNTPGLTSSRIVYLFEDRAGQLWVGTETGGVVLVRPGEVTATGIGRGTAGKRLVAMCVDSVGAVWLHLADGQLWRYQDGRFSPFLFDAGQASAYRGLIAEREGGIWVGADQRLAALSPTPGPGMLEPRVDRESVVRRLDYLLGSRFGGYWRLADGRVQRWRAARLEQDWGGYPWSTVPIGAACEDQAGRLVVGTLGGGVFWYDGTTNLVWLSTQQGLANNIVLALCVDTQGNLWVGTDGGGLNRVKPKLFQLAEPTRGQVVQSVSLDGEGGLWIGSNGGGITHWRQDQVQTYGSELGLTNSHVWSILVGRDQRVWAGTWGGGLFQFEEGRFHAAPGADQLSPAVLALHEDRRGKLWLGTLHGLAMQEDAGWRVFTTKDGLSSDVVRAIADDPAGSLWIGTVGGGLNRRRDQGFDVWRKTDGLPSDDVSALHVDGEGVLWIGTFGSGLARWEQGRITRYSTRDGLISNSIGHMIDDDRGNLWIGSNAGIMRVPKAALNQFAHGTTSFLPCRVFGRPDGMLTRECVQGSQPGACRGPDGRLWFPTVKGLVSVDPRQLDPNPKPPAVRIEAVLLDGQPQFTNSLRAVPPESVTIPPRREHLEIHYTSLNLAAPERGRFRYRLEGHETGWTEAGVSRIARYAKLPPNQYRFRVQASNEDGAWSDANPASTAQLTVIVVPPVWRTWWFLTTAGALLLGGITGLVHYISTQRLERQLEGMRQAELLERERARIARDLHDQLGATLTQVALLSEMVEADKDQPVEVETHARQISQAARDTTRVLDEIVWAVNPSNDTLEGLVNYACKNAQDYLSVAGLRCRLDVPAELPARPLPPDVRHNVFLAFKEAVTNVVRHAAASSVWIRLRLDPGRFTLEVEDNGKGLGTSDPAAASSRNGLRNMRQRLEEIGGECSLSSPPEGGTCVRLSAPLAGRSK